MYLNILDLIIDLKIINFFTLIDYFCKREQWVYHIFHFLDYSKTKNSYQ